MMMRKRMRLVWTTLLRNSYWNSYETQVKEALEEYVNEVKWNNHRLDISLLKQTKTRHYHINRLREKLRVARYGRKVKDMTYRDIFKQEKRWRERRLRNWYENVRSCLKMRRVCECHIKRGRKRHCGTQQEMDQMDDDSGVSRKLLLVIDRRRRVTEKKNSVSWLLNQMKAVNELLERVKHSAQTRRWIGGGRVVERRSQFHILNQMKAVNTLEIVKHNYTNFFWCRSGRAVEEI